MSRSLNRTLLEWLVARRPVRALQLSCARLGVSALELKLAEDSPLFSPAGGRAVELPVDDIIAPVVLKHGVWQPRELEFLVAHAPHTATVLFDIGANVGLVTRQLIHRLPQVVAAVCFEPHPGHFRLLQRNLAHLPQCHAVQAAVGERAGVLTFYEDTHNAGNCSLNLEAMHGVEYRTTVVQCVPATEAQLFSPLPPTLRPQSVIWKSDTQGFDEVIATSLGEDFWQRVHLGVMELWRIDRPAFDQQRFASLLAGFSVRRFAHDPSRNLTVEEILAYSAGRDRAQSDLLFARA